MSVLWQMRRKQTTRFWIESGIALLIQDQPAVKAYCKVNTWFGGHPDTRGIGNEFTNKLRDIQVAEQSLQSLSDTRERTTLDIVHHAGLVWPTYGHGACCNLTLCSISICWPHNSPQLR